MRNDLWESIEGLRDNLYRISKRNIDNTSYDEYIAKALSTRALEYNDISEMFEFLYLLDNLNRDILIVALFKQDNMVSIKTDIGVVHVSLKGIDKEVTSDAIKIMVSERVCRYDMTGTESYTPDITFDSVYSAISSIIQYVDNDSTITISYIPA